ncbi:MAG: hypothetical protein M0Z61_10290 [Nitrospiraceae bacterium]|nr:hypothetical protein [Nitrospiraceae bacterium]
MKKLLVLLLFCFFLLGCNEGAPKPQNKHFDINTALKAAQEKPLSPEGRWQVTRGTATDPSILLDTQTGETWALRYMDTKDRGRVFIWEKLHTIGS